MSTIIPEVCADATDKLDQVPVVEIEVGRFKYILMKVYDPTVNPEKCKHVIRGNTSAEFHADIFSIYEQQLKTIELDPECVGGGRILNEPDKKSFHIYGYSTAYGKADHAVTCEILKKAYPGHTISWSDEGY